MGKKAIEILWTGGFDSTFRVVQLSMLPVIIQPYYLSDQRPSENMELNAIEEISKIIRMKPATHCEILPLKYIKECERIIAKEISESYRQIRKNHYLGSQYDWLGCFASNHRGIELTIEKDDIATKLINKLGRLLIVTDEFYGNFYIINTENSPKEIISLFENFHFPLADMTKLEMKSKYIEWGCEDIMNLTWFCYSPIDEEPCGKCNPCKYTIEDGLKERFSKKALRRYWMRKYLSPLLKLESRILKITKKVIRKIKSYSLRWSNE